MSRLPAAGESPDAYARFSKEQWSKQDEFYATWTARWKRTIDFIRALHWRILQELDDKQLKSIPEWRRFPVANFTLAFFSDYVTQFMQSQVRFSAVPSSADPQEISSAELADQVLRDLWDKLGMESKRLDLAAWLVATGNAHIRIFWNSNTGDMIPLAVPQPNPQDPEGEPILVPINPETLQPDPTMEQPIMLDAGEIGIEVVPPQLVRWANRRSHGAMLGRLLTYDDVVEQYGIEVAESLSYQKMTGSLSIDMLSVFPAGEALADEECALIIEHYLPKSSRNPDGLWWTSSHHTILTPPQPLPSREIPLIPFKWIPMPGYPALGLSPLYDITFSNKVYDELLGRMLEWMGKVVPKIIRQSGDGLRYNEFTDEPFQDVVVNPGMAPTPLQVPAPPEHFFRMKQDSTEDALMVGGYKLRRTEKLPPGEATQRFRQPPKTTGEGEQVALALINSRASWQKLGYVLLDYVARFYTESRVVSMVGVDRTYQWREFKGSDLANLKARIHVDELPLYTWNRQSMRDSVFAILNTQAGSILFTGADGQLDRERVNAALEATGLDVSLETLDPDVLEARNENHIFRGLQEGVQPPQVESWQNDDIHYAEHTREMKSLSFRGMTPYAQQALLEHTSGHEQRMAERQQGEQQAMLAQEKALREIRSATETTQDIKTELGKQLVTALVEILAGADDDDKKKLTSKKE